MIVGVIGEGEWAKGLCSLIAEAGHSPKVGYQKRAIPGFKGTPNLPHLCSEADLIIYTCASNELLPLIERSKLRPGNFVIISAKGLEPKTGRWLSSVVAEESPAIRVGAIAGPAIPSEIALRHPSALVVASRYQEVSRRCQQALHSGICRVYSSEDLIGIELAGAMTGMLCIAMGLADSLQQGLGARGVIVARGLAEAARLGKVLGADEHSFLGLAGVGDIIANGTENPKYKTGRALGSSGRIDDQSLSELQALLTLAENNKVELPLAKAILAMAKGQLEPRLALDLLMRRAPTAE